MKKIKERYHNFLCIEKGNQTRIKRKLRYFLSHIYFNKGIKEEKLKDRILYYNNLEKVFLTREINNLNEDSFKFFYYFLNELKPKRLKNIPKTFKSFKKCYENIEILKEDLKICVENTEPESLFKDLRNLLSQKV